MARRTHRLDCRESASGEIVPERDSTEFAPMIPHVKRSIPLLATNANGRRHLVARGSPRTSAVITRPRLDVRRLFLAVHVKSNPAPGRTYHQKREATHRRWALLGCTLPQAQTAHCSTTGAEEKEIHSQMWLCSLCLTAFCHSVGAWRAHAGVCLVPGVPQFCNSRHPVP
ncbi:hypothetical protein L226DRAFT_326175 [Lentinus tigrinus ALCF2SS1-7]|uniref:Uncharacterized protein n=1 Tax=Lentinus tigrinus ALCF2SS1-6 TaxID=1328759 RepID=A0A5C2SFU5_9APHY|nr:hypothetical protein L227DRAFT_432782 [Lentinus tigrinus ALCF2SS1-6]RPD77576.1 hypothetical protein L226DRAFT_326175 [Lentinus tigrinus ALCF2SS1-7]